MAISRGLNCLRGRPHRAGTVGGGITRARCRLALSMNTFGSSARRYIAEMNALEHRLEQIYQQVSDFEAAQSVANTGTGSRREGEGFERLFGELWEAVRALAATQGDATCSFVSREGTGVGRT